MNMKKIYQLILGLSAFAWLAPAAMAQNIPAGQYKEENGVAYNKSVSQTPDENGRYTIELDAFVTGKVKTVTEYKPADIVLVLDVSGSMENATGAYIEDAKEGGFTYSNLGGAASEMKMHFFKHNGNYYQVKTKSVSGGYVAYYYAERYNHYLKADGTVFRSTHQGTEAVYPSEVSANGLAVTNKTDVIWPNSLYRKQSRLEALKDAAASFIDKIAENDTKDQDGNTIESIGHQLSIVTFAGDSDVVSKFFKVSDQAKVDNAKSAVNNLTVGTNGTMTNLGMERALVLLNKLGTSSAEANKVVVLFTDGEPHDLHSDQNEPLNYQVANKAITAAHSVKKDYNGLVFSIGLLPADTDTDVLNFLKYVSSDYPDATDMSNHGDPGPGPDPSDAESTYSQRVGGEDLTSIFEAIAESASSTAGNTSVTAEASVMTDIVSSSFKIPEAANVELLVAPCLGKVAGAWQFGEAKDAKQYEPWKSDATEPVPAYAADEDNSNIIHVTGFDFSKHFCAVDGEGNIVNDKGAYKLVLRFQVAVNEDAIGGPAVATNDPESGIYVDSTPIVKFNQPSMHSPSVSLVIVKQGLKTGETAQYTIQRRAATDEDFDPIANPDYDPENAYTDYLNVLVIGDEQEEQTYTKTDGTTVKGRIVRIDGLDSNYYYRVKETDWSWTYKNGALTPITSKTLTNNPFIFSNTKQETGIKNAESVKRNEFN